MNPLVTAFPAKLVAAAAGTCALTSCWQIALSALICVGGHSSFHSVAGGWSRSHGSAAATAYAQRRTALLEAVRLQGITAFGRSGFNVWLPVLDESAMVTHLLAHGWAVAAGQRFRFQTSPAVRITAARRSPAEARISPG
jgi:DNA-binding transcriptional MocR family regulator